MRTFIISQNLSLTYHLVACGCSQLAKQKGWQICNCTPKGCPLTWRPAEKAAGSAHQPGDWKGHCALVLVLVVRSSPWRHPHWPCSGEGCCPSATWWGSGTHQMFLLGSQSSCYCPSPRKLAWRRCLRFLAQCVRVNCSGDPDTLSHCRARESQRECAGSSCWTATTCEHPAGSHLGGEWVLDRYNPPCEGPGTCRWLDNFPLVSARQMR